MLAIPAAVRNRAVALDAHDWLATVDDLVADVAARWSLRLGDVFPDGTEAVVVAVTLTDGTEAVLKVGLPGRGDAVRHEATVLRLAAGHGCVRLLRSDEAKGILLLERLGPSLHALDVPVARQHDILCATAQEVWRPGPGCDLPTAVAKCRWFAEEIPRAWEETGRPCSVAAVENALACAARRMAAHDDERSLVVHGDVHAWNALQAPDGGFRLVDPDGLLSEPEYDLGVIMREDPVEMLTGDPFARARRLAAGTGLDATAIWEWGVVERVSTGLLCARTGLQPVGRQMLAVADRVATLHIR